MIPSDEKRARELAEQMLRMSGGDKIHTGHLARVLLPLIRDQGRIDWLDEQCSEQNGRHIYCLPGHLRAAIDKARGET